MITIVLTEEEAKLLADTLLSVEDAGPDGYGWQSEELSALSDEIQKQVYPVNLESEDING